MHLKDVIDQIVGGPPPVEPTDERPIISTVFARKKEGQFRPESEAMIIDMHAEEELKRYEREGLYYFLEVHLVQELWQDWTEYLKSHRGHKSPLDALIYYAENDGFPLEA